MKKKALALFLALCMVLSLLPVTAMAADEEDTTDQVIENPFEDVPDGKFYTEAVLWAVGNGVTEGKTATTFVPGDICTRGQAVTFLWRAAGSPEATIDNPFEDVEEDKFYTKAVLWAVENGITEGMTKTSFAPNGKCTRAQIVTFLWRANGSPVVTNTTHAFEDVEEGKFYTDAVVWAVAHGITKGDGKATTFNPTGDCIRAQIVTFLYRASAMELTLEDKMDDYWYNQLDGYLKNSAGYPQGSEGMGAVVLAVKDGEVIFEKAYGYAHYYDAAERSTYYNPVYEKIDDPREMTTDTLFDLASVTKVMATTQSIMLLVDQGLLSVEDTVAEYWPEFGTKGKENITVAQLLTHSSGLPQWEATYLYCDDHDEQMEYIENLDIVPEYATDGSEPKYSDFSFMTLGFLVEKITGEQMEDYVKENVYEPLGMTSTTYVPLENGFTEDQIAATSLGNPYEYRMVDEENWSVGYDCTKDAEAFAEFDGWRDYTLIGEVNDGNAGMGGQGVAGHAGLFSTASDLAILLQCMLDGGKYIDADGNEQQLYSEETVKLFTAKHTSYAEAHDGALSEEFGYGFKLDQSWMGKTATENVFGHDGFTGTTVFADPDNDYIFVCLTNKMQCGFRQSVANGDSKDVSNYYNTNSWVSWNMNQIVKDELGI